MTEPAADGLQLTHEHGLALRISHRDQELARYVYQPWDPQLESPRPYFHPVRTLSGDVVSLFRPHDHVWHKGIAFSLPNMGRPGDPEQENFWGGVTYLRGRGYEQLDNNGTIRHREFTELDASPKRVDVAHRLDWLTQAGDTWFDEHRAFGVSVDGGAWVLSYTTVLRNVSGGAIAIGSPTTQGRENAGYGGLFWRGPRSFTGGTVITSGVTGGDELMGSRASWLGFTGQHDDHGRFSTVLFVDSPHNSGHPTQWFVRSQPYACVCPAPFFDTETEIADGDALTLRFAVVVADGAPGPDGGSGLAELGRAALAESAAGLAEPETSAPAHGGGS
jgi:hypothetical protein